MVAVALPCLFLSLAHFCFIHFLILFFVFYFYFADSNGKDKRILHIFRHEHEHEHEHENMFPFPSVYRCLARVGFVYCRTRHCSLLCHLFDFPIGKATTFLGRMRKANNNKIISNEIKMNKSVTNDSGKKRLDVTFLWVHACLPPVVIFCPRRRRCASLELKQKKTTSHRVNSFLKVYSFHFTFFPSLLLNAYCYFTFIIWVRFFSVPMCVCLSCCKWIDECVLHLLPTIHTAHAKTLEMFA